MTSPYPAIEQWVVPDAAIVSTLAGVRPASAAGRESGAFWLGRRDRIAVVMAVALPSGQGVEERPGRWSVSAGAYGTISRWARPRGMTLVAVVHTHLKGVPARLSSTDRNRGVHAPGLLSVVIDHGGEKDHTDGWGWFVYENSDYRQLSPGEVKARVMRRGGRDIVTVRFDEQRVLHD